MKNPSELDNHKSVSTPDIATQIMQSMVRMPPKPHEEMKLGKSKGQMGPKRKPAKPGKPRS